MRGFGHATIFIPSFQGLRYERLAQWPPFCVINTKKTGLQIMRLAAYASETNQTQDFFCPSYYATLTGCLHEGRNILEGGSS